MQHKDNFKTEKRTWKERKPCKNSILHHAVTRRREHTSLQVAYNPCTQKKRMRALKTLDLKIMTNKTFNTINDELGFITPSLIFKFIRSQLMQSIGIWRLKQIEKREDRIWPNSNDLRPLESKVLVSNIAKYVIKPLRLSFEAHFSIFFS